MISFGSSFENTDVAVPDPEILIWIAASVADAAAVNPNGTETPLANSLSIFLIKFLVMAQEVYLEIPLTVP